MSIVNIEKLLEKAIKDGVIYCLYCNYSYLEPDYNTCPECDKGNPLKEQGLI